MLEPIIAPRMGFGPMLHRVVAQEKLYEPRIGLRFALRLVEMVERFVHFLHRAEWPLHEKSRWVPHSLLWGGKRGSP